MSYQPTRPVVRRSRGESDRVCVCRVLIARGHRAQLNRQLCQCPLGPAPPYPTAIESLKSEIFQSERSAFRFQIARSESPRCDRERHVDEDECRPKLDGLKGGEIFYFAARGVNLR